MPETRNHQPAELSGVKLTITLKEKKKHVQGKSPPKPNTLNEPKSMKRNYIAPISMVLVQIKMKKADDMSGMEAFSSKYGWCGHGHPAWGLLILRGLLISCGGLQPHLGRTSPVQRPSPPPPASAAEGDGAAPQKRS